MGFSQYARTAACTSLRLAGNVYVLLVLASAAYCACLFTGLGRWGPRDWDEFTCWYELPRLAYLRYFQLPLWNPYVGGGTVLLAHPDSPSLSPWYLPVLVLGAPLGVRIEVLMFVALGATGTAALLRRWNVSTAGCFTGGVVLMMSSHFALHIAEGHLEWCALGLMPWVFLFLLRSGHDRRSVVYGALVLASALLHGSVYVVAMFVPFFGVWALFEWIRTRSWNVIGNTLGMIVLTFLLCAVVLFPRLEFVRANPRDPDRPDRITSEVVARMFLDPRQVELYQVPPDLPPEARPDPAPLPRPSPLQCWLRSQGWECDWHEFGCYVTWLGLVMAAVGMAASFRLLWPLYAAGALAGLVMLADSSPIDLWSLVQRMPLYGSLHVPTRILVVIVFVLAISAGFGVSWFGRWAKGLAGRRPGRLLEIAVAAAVYGELAVMGSNLFNDIFVYPPRPVPSFERFAQRFKASEVRYPEMYSALLPYLRGNSGVLEHYDVLAVRRGDVRLTTDPDYRGEAYLENGRGRARITDWSMSRVKVCVEVEAGDRVVLNQNYFVGWKAICRGDGRQCRRLPAEPSGGRLVSIGVGKDDREVEFYYLPNSFLWGAVVSVLTLLGCVVALGFKGVSVALPIPRLRPRLSWPTVVRGMGRRADLSDRFERRFAEFVGVEHALAVASGRAGLSLILQSLKLPRGSRVALASLNTPIVPNVLLHHGLKPLFVDVCEADGTLSAADLQAALDDDTSAVIATHLEGFPCNVQAIEEIARRRSIPIIEDCAHACGTLAADRHVGTFGVAGFFSFGLGKNLNAAGGGMFTTNSERLAASVRATIAEGPARRPPADLRRLFKAAAAAAAFSPPLFPLVTWPAFCVSLLGFGFDPVVKAFEDSGADTRQYNHARRACMKMSPLSAAMGLDGLANLADRVAAKRRHAQSYRRALGPRVLAGDRDGQLPSFQECCLRTGDPRRLQRRLLLRGVDSQRTWMTACSSLPPFAGYARPCPVAEQLAREILYLPNYPEMSPAAVRRVARLVEALA